jgi:hypothetical protein
MLEKIRIFFGKVRGQHQSTRAPDMMETKRAKTKK